MEPTKEDDPRAFARSSTRWSGSLPRVTWTQRGWLCPQTSVSGQTWADPLESDKADSLVGVLHAADDAVQTREVAPDHVIDIDEKGHVCEVTAARSLCYRFLDLSPADRLEIVQNFGFLTKEDCGLPDAELFAKWFERARRGKMLGLLWDAVESKHGGSMNLVNPYAGR